MTHHRCSHRPISPMVWLAALAIIGVLAISGVQMHRAGLWFQPTDETRLEAFDRLCGILELHYPYFKAKDIDWDGLRSRYRPRVAAATDDDAFFALLAEMLDELGDGHTGVVSPYPKVACYGTTLEVEGRAVVTSLGPSATAAGLVVGDVVENVAGQPANEVIVGLDPRLRTGSTDRARRRSAFEHLLCGPNTGVLQVGVVGDDGDVRDVDIRRLDPTTALPDLEPAVVARRLPEGPGLIKLRRLYAEEGRDLVADFDAALDGLDDPPGLILDLRGNGGGDSILGDAIAGRFVDEAFRYGQERYQERLPFRLWSLSFDYIVTPRGARYAGRIVVIIDTAVASSAEQFVAALVDGAGAVTVGRSTAGSSGNPIRIELRGGLIRISTGDFRRNDGTPIEGVGFSPDIAVAWSIDDVNAGRDPDLEAAVLALTR
ncbi:MAG TPA: S41 family peptidase [Anaerolineales bacterium]|nr:S41 family peptidase [Anaerolineales bacterium]